MKFADAHDEEDEAISIVEAALKEAAGENYDVQTGVTQDRR
jgi:hypothetical protein